MSRRLVFRHTVEGLFVRAYGAQVTPALQAQFRELGLESPSVDAEKFAAGFNLLRDALFPGVDRAQAEREMGAKFLAGYFDTAMGGLVKVMLKLLSVEKALARVPQSLMSGANFIEARIETRAPHDVHVVMSDYSTSPHFLCGVVDEMVRRAGGKDVRCEVVQEQGRSAVLRVRWA